MYPTSVGRGGQPRGIPSLAARPVPCFLEGRPSPKEITMKKLQKGFTLIELMIVVAIIGILAAVAIPNFIKFQARSKQSEAKANLKASFTAMKAYYQEKDKYSSIVTEIGFVPERNNRYAYFLDGAAPVLSNRLLGVETYPAGSNGIGVDLFKGYVAIAYQQ